MAEKRTHDGHLTGHVYTAPSTIHGTGVFATRPFAKGEYIATFWGPEARRDGTYVLWVFDHQDATRAVGRRGRNLLRYLNHAQPGNAEFDGFDLYARVRIAAGAEITFNYHPD
jgi:hypothetical protein